MFIFICEKYKINEVIFGGGVSASEYINKELNIFVYKLPENEHNEYLEFFIKMKNLLLENFITKQKDLHILPC